MTQLEICEHNAKYWQGKAAALYERIDSVRDTYTEGQIASMQRQLAQRYVNARAWTEMAMIECSLNAITWPR